jgi:hypothetical protein
MATGTPVDYTVSAVVADTQYTTQGKPVPGKRVTYSTSVGYDGTVFIPDSDFANMDMVRLRIEAEVRMVAAAYGLAGTVSG